MSEIEKRPVSIYGIKNPLTDEVLYVGASMTPKRRLATHMYGGCWNKNSYRYKQVRSLWLAKVKPELIILGETNIEGAKALEQYWIDYYVSRGFCKGQARSSGYTENKSAEYRKVIWERSRIKRKTTP
jgi:hypothetical protein